MTKQEVRAVSVAKLKLSENSVLIDVGAGTGSVGIQVNIYSLWKSVRRGEKV